MDGFTQLKDELWAGPAEDADAIAMHPETLKDIKRHVYESSLPDDGSLREEDEDQAEDPSAPRVNGWPVMEYADLDRGMFKFVKIL